MYDVCTLVSERERGGSGASAVGFLIVAFIRSATHVTRFYHDHLGLGIGIGSNARNVAVAASRGVYADMPCTSPTPPEIRPGNRADPGAAEVAIGSGDSAVFPVLLSAASLPDTEVSAGSAVTVTANPEGGTRPLTLSSRSKAVAKRVALPNCAAAVRCACGDADTATVKLMRVLS
jgi:hypothetical protein